MNFCDPQSVGLEPTLPEGIWFLVRRLNHSATTASTDTWEKYDKYIGILYILKWKFWILFNLITEANSSIVSIVFIVLNESSITENLCSYIFYIWRSIIFIFKKAINS